MVTISLKEVIAQVEEHERFAKESRERYMFSCILTLLEELKIRRAFDAKEKRERD